MGSDLSRPKNKGKRGVCNSKTYYKFYVYLFNLKII